MLICQKFPKLLHRAAHDNGPVGQNALRMILEMARERDLSEKNFCFIPEQHNNTLLPAYKWEQSERERIEEESARRASEDAARIAALEADIKKLRAMNTEFVNKSLRWTPGQKSDDRCKLLRQDETLMAEIFTEFFTRQWSLPELAEAFTSRVGFDVTENAVRPWLFRSAPPIKLISAPGKGQLTWAEIWFLGAVLVGPAIKDGGWAKRVFKELGIKERRMSLRGNGHSSLDDIPQKKVEALRAKVCGLVDGEKMKKIRDLLKKGSKDRTRRFILGVAYLAGPNGTTRDDVVEADRSAENKDDLENRLANIQKRWNSDIAKEIELFPVGDRWVHSAFRDYHPKEWKHHLDTVLLKTMVDTETESKGKP